LPRRRRRELGFGHDVIFDVPGSLAKNSRSAMSILGQVSYSIYLVHLIVIAAVMRVVPHPLAVWSDFQANVLLTGVLVVLPVVALALHLVIERPFFSFKRVYVLPGKPQLHEIVPAVRLRGIDAD
jgi:peptidoglycan/LPS O-acetylase OafA/YrhL